MSRTRPFGEEAALAIDVDETFHHLRALIRINQIEEWEEAAEGVPEARARVEIALAHLAVVGRAVYYLSLCILFPIFHREEQRAIKAGIESASFGCLMLYGFAVDGDASQHLVPDVMALCFHSIKRCVSNLALQIQGGLFGTDIR